MSILYEVLTVVLSVMHEGYDTKANHFENLQVEAAVEQLCEDVIGSQERDERHQKVVIDCSH